jgi:hypothetical protein
MTVKLLLETSQSEKVEKWLKDYLKQKCADIQKRGRKGVVVFDIDGTLVREDRPEATPIHSMRSIYRAALRNGCELYIVTARPNMRKASSTLLHGDVSNLELTKRELDRAGYDSTKFRHIHMLPMKDSSAVNYSKYKLERRRDAEEHAGEPMILNVGDQWSDLMLMPPFRKTMPQVIMKNGTKKSVYDLHPRKYYVLAVKEPGTERVVVSVKLPDRIVELPNAAAALAAGASIAAASGGGSGVASAGTGSGYKATKQRKKK